MIWVKEYYNNINHCIVSSVLLGTKSFSWCTNQIKAPLHKLCVWTQVRKIKRKSLMRDSDWLKLKMRLICLICVQTQFICNGAIVCNHAHEVKRERLCFGNFVWKVCVLSLVALVPKTARPLGPRTRCGQDAESNFVNPHSFRNLSAYSWKVPLTVFIPSGLIPRILPAVNTMGTMIPTLVRVWLGQNAEMT